ncbi:protein transparent testa 12 [Phtheirospermum japonicum]|uniref:Protein transparent testa 12 n=1 Tax=Phtheirospermum japonicum TaxID=374723 RepID=A0A830BAH8_9LAMI|nr:protein transparent testa 12 [Phtheirospermum japonicum]
MTGIYLQRSWFIDLITLSILLPVFIFATPIFNLLGEEQDISKSADYISLWFIPFVYGTIFILTIQMYLQAQKNMIIAWLSAICNPHFIVLDFCECARFRHHGRNGCAFHIVMVCCVWRICVHFWRLVSGYVERVHFSCNERFVAGVETIDIVWCDDMLGIMVLCDFGLTGWIHEKCKGCNICLFHLVS